MSNTGNWGGDKIIVYLPRKDEKRNRHWCAHYRNKDNFCEELNGKCRGSAQCPYYKLLTTPPKPGNDYYKIELIDLKDIIVPEDRRRSLDDEIKIIYKFCYECKTFKEIITVYRDNGKYVLMRGYRYYYVAKELGLKQIYAIILDKKPIDPEPKNDLWDLIRKKGTYLKHRTLGKVVVINSTPDRITVETASGEKKDLSIEAYLKYNLIQIIES